MDKMAHEMHGTLFGNVQSVSGGTYEAGPLGEEAFLMTVVTPIYEVLRKVATSKPSISSISIA